MKKFIGNLFLNVGGKILGIRRNDLDNFTVGKLLLRERYRENFEVQEFIEKENECILIVIEKNDRIPEELKGKEVILNGYKEKIEIIEHPFMEKLFYIQFFRRKWKEKGGTESYSNTYELHPPGMKATQEFGDFLKELTRQERHEFFCAFPNIRHISEKDF